jgi:hypothetical protein
MRHRDRRQVAGGPELDLVGEQRLTGEIAGREGLELDGLEAGLVKPAFLLGNDMDEERQVRTDADGQRVGLNLRGGGRAGCKEQAGYGGGYQGFQDDAHVVLPLVV